MKRYENCIAVLLIASAAFAQTDNPFADHNRENPPAADPSSLSVMISYFKAEQQGNAVIITWETKVEINHAGFNLHRRGAMDLSYVRINPQLISEGRKSAEGTLYEFVDIPPKPGVYMYQLEDMNLEGYSNYSSIISIQVSEFITNVADGTESVRAFRVHPNYPNPFNACTTISFELERDEYISVLIVDTSGKAVEELYRGSLAAGRHDLIWHAETAASGIYYAFIQSPMHQVVQKMTLIK